MPVGLVSVTAIAREVGAALIGLLAPPAGVATGVALFVVGLELAALVRVVGTALVGLLVLKQRSRIEDRVPEAEEFVVAAYSLSPTVPVHSSSASSSVRSPPCKSSDTKGNESTWPLHTVPYKAIRRQSVRQPSQSP